MNVVLQKKPHKHIPKGDVFMPKKPNESSNGGNIVETYKLGNTTVHICDDCFAKTPEEIKKVLDDYHAAGWAIVLDLAAKGIVV